MRIFYIFLATPVCPTNEVYSVCGNDNCRPTCIKPDTTGCVPTCSTGACICATGFVRNDAGVCVLPSQCRENIFAFKFMLMNLIKIQLY